MERKIKGFALMLLSLILMEGASALGWRKVFDFSFKWRHLCILLGIIGFILVVCSPVRSVCPRSLSS